MTPIFVLAAILSLMAILFGSSSSDAIQKHEDCSCKDDPCVDKPRRVSYNSRYDVEVKIEMNQAYYTRNKKGGC